MALPCFAFLFKSKTQLARIDIASFWRFRLKMQPVFVLVKDFGPIIMRFVVLIMFICVGAAGCNADPRCRRETALLRAEILDLEDKYYLLKSQHQNALNDLNSYRGSNDSTDANLDDGQIIYESEMPVYEQQGDQVYRNEGFSFDEAPSSIPGQGNVQPFYGVEQPNLEINEPETIYPAEPTQSEQLPAPDSSSNQRRSGVMLNSPESQSTSTQTLVTEIVINRGQSRGHDVDGEPGDEGLNLLIQPKTARGETMLTSGELTISIIDPLEPAANQRIGIWKFLPKETELFFAEENETTRGILLHLPWDQALPQNKEIVVFVRFTTPDGRRLETSSQIRIAPPTKSYSTKEPLIANWSQQDRRWLSNGAGESLSGSIGEPVSINDQFNAPEISSLVDEFDQGMTIPARPASSGTSRIQKPTWRPVR